MCARVELVDVLPSVAAWDPDRLTILVRQSADRRAVMREVRAILSDLSAPAEAGTPLCYCATPLPLLPLLDDGDDASQDTRRDHRRGA